MLTKEMAVTWQVKAFSRKGCERVRRWGREKQR